MTPRPNGRDTVHLVSGVALLVEWSADADSGRICCPSAQIARIDIDELRSEFVAEVEETTGRRVQSFGMVATADGFSVCGFELHPETSAYTTRPDPIVQVPSCFTLRVGETTILIHFDSGRSAVATWPRLSGLTYAEVIDRIEIAFRLHENRRRIDTVNAVLGQVDANLRLRFTVVDQGTLLVRDYASTATPSISRGWRFRAIQTFLRDVVAPRLGLPIHAHDTCHQHWTRNLLGNRPALRFILRTFRGRPLRRRSFRERPRVLELD